MMETSDDQGIRTEAEQADFLVEATRLVEKLERQEMMNQLQRMFAAFVMKSIDSKQRPYDIEIGTHTGISTLLNAGYAVFFCYPGTWSDESRADLEAYGHQVQQWIGQKMDNVYARDLARKGGNVWQRINEQSP